MSKSISSFILLVLIAAILMGCSAPVSPTPTKPATATVSPATATPVLPSVTPTPAPTATPTIQRLVLVAPKEADTRLVAPLKTALSELAAESGYTLETRISIQPADIDPSWKVVVFLSTPANLTELASAGSRTQFIVPAAAQPRDFPNINWIRLHPDRLAFMAGYLATLVASDWRSGGLFSADDPQNVTIQEAFLNGGRYLCGRCSPYYAPIVAFPISAAVPTSSNLAARKAAVDDMQKKILKAIYVDPALATTDLWTYLVSLKYSLIGSVTPADDLKPRWVATVHEDIISQIQALWPDLVAGKGGKSVDALLELIDINADLFSPGKQRLAVEILDGLNQGSIAPLNPAP